jgi:hypothetical protein
MIASPCEKFTLDKSRSLASIKPSKCEAWQLNQGIDIESIQTNVWANTGGMGVIVPSHPIELSVFQLRDAEEITTRRQAK